MELCVQCRRHGHAAGSPLKTGVALASSSHARGVSTFERSPERNAPFSRQRADPPSPSPGHRQRRWFGKEWVGGPSTATPPQWGQAPVVWARSSKITLGGTARWGWGLGGIAQRGRPRGDPAPPPPHWAAFSPQTNGHNLMEACALGTLPFWAALNFAKTERNGQAGRNQGGERRLEIGAVEGGGLQFQMVEGTLAHVDGVRICGKEVENRHPANT